MLHWAIARFFQYKAIVHSLVNCVVHNQQQLQQPLQFFYNAQIQTQNFAHNILHWAIAVLMLQYKVIVPSLVNYAIQLQNLHQVQPPQR